MVESSWQKKKVTNILQNLAAAYLANRQFENAIEKFLQLKALGDDDPSTYLGLAGAFLGLKNTTPEALESYRRFCDLFPEDGELISNIAELLLANRVRGEEAFHVYRSALAFHPPFEGELHLILLEALEQRGDLPLAVQAARSAALLPGGAPYAVRKLVSLSWRQKRFDDLLQELMILAEQPALRLEVNRDIALTFAYRAYANGAALTSKEATFVRNEISSLHPLKTVAQARDWCLLQLAVARSERPPMILEEQVATENEIESANPIARAKGLPETGAAHLMSRRFSDMFFAIAGEESGATLENYDGGQTVFSSTAEERAVMVMAVDALPSSKATEPLFGDDSLRTFIHGMHDHAKHIRVFEDGFIAVADHPFQLVEMATAMLRRWPRSGASSGQTTIRPRMLIHTSPGNVHESLRTLDSINTALQLMGAIPASHQAAGRDAVAHAAKLFITAEALDVDPEARMFAVTNRRKLPAGLVGPVVEVGEIIWQDPFEALDDSRRVQIGRFVVGERICNTEIFSTFTVRDQTLGITAILKTFSPRRVIDFDEEELTQAIRRVGRLTHPGLALVHNMGKHEGIFYFVREYVEGRSLADEQSFSQVRNIAKVMTLGMQACRALHSAHREGVLHLNLKPSNFWITPEGKIKLSDFSLPGVYDPMSAAGAAERERNYIAPELREFAGSSPASDVYSLAALLFLLISHLPATVAEEDFFTALDVVSDHRVPERLKEILFAAVAHDPLARPQSMLEFERQLRECQSSLPHANL